MIQLDQYPAGILHSKIELFTRSMPTPLLTIFATNGLDFRNVTRTSISVFLLLSAFFVVARFVAYICVFVHLRHVFGRQ